MSSPGYKAGIVLFNPGAFGGAPKRFTNLFKHLDSQYPNTFYYFINDSLYHKLKEIYPDLNYNNIIKVGPRSATSSQEQPKVEPKEPEQNPSYIRKIYWYWKNKHRQKKLFEEIEKHRNKLGINIFLGVFGGVLPLMFYVNKTPRKAGVIFCDMDSWFSGILSDTKKEWYKKYFSFNDALENSDAVDFLSPFIKEGVKKRGVNLKEENCNVTSSSFTDYSKCIIGSKKKFEIAFAGRLEPDKNPMMFLESAKEIISKGYDVHFHLLGEGGMENMIQKFINDNGLKERVNFQFHNNPPEILAETTVFVSIQTTNNYPSQSVLEAMACGNAIIASDAGDTGMLINNSNGILIPLNKDALTAAMETLIKNKDEALNLGKSGREFVIKEHTLEKSAEYYLTLFDKTYWKVFNG